MNSRAERSQAGFTLLELIVVFAIIGLVLALFIGRPMHPSSRVEARGTAEQIGSALRLARAQAIASNHSIAFVVDLAQHSYSIFGAPPKQLPPELGVAVESVSGAVLGERAVIEFLPDGSSTGGRIDISVTGTHFLVGIDWLTGRVTIVNAG
jgi:general secretion pathway protein H